MSLLRIGLAILVLVVIGVVVLVIEAKIASSGGREGFQNPSHEPRTFGTSGTPLTLVVIGDSTAAGQGAPYERGIAVTAATHLAANHVVTLHNLAISGATAQDVREKEADEATALKPDVVLLAVGANDVTHLTSGGALRRELTDTINRLLAARCETTIVLTGSPDMGGARRLPQPLRWIAGERTKHLNNLVETVVRERQLTFAPVARETGPLFRRNPKLLADDRFHPNASGYATWIPVITSALDTALRDQPSHCAAISH